MDGLNWELMVYMSVKHRGQWPKSSTPRWWAGASSLPLMVRLLQHKVLHQSAKLSQETVLATGTLASLHLECGLQLGCSLPGPLEISCPYSLVEL